MIAPIEQPKLPLIQSHHVDADKGVVTLTIPNANDALAASIKQEVQGITQGNKFPARFDVKHEANTVTITIQSDNVAFLAMNASKIMTRRVQVFDETSNGEVVKYASLADIKSVLGSLKEHAKKTSPNAVLGIDRLIGVAEQIERI